MNNHFNPLPPYGGRPSPSISIPESESFQSTPSVWRETACIRRCRTCYGHFNPLPPYGGRLNSPWRLASHESFQSTPSVWRETSRSTLRLRLRSISIHSLRMEGDLLLPHNRDLPRPISIHSLRMEGDGTGKSTSLRNFISIHSLRMEGDRKPALYLPSTQSFQSTPSVWRETH